MKWYKFTDYFENEVLKKRTYLKKEGVFVYLKIRSRVNDKRKIDLGFGVKYLSLKDGSSGWLHLRTK